MGFITSKLPCHYVDYLCHPGLQTRAGIVPLQMYIGAHKNGAKSELFLTELFAANLADLDDRSWTPRSCVPPNELAIMKKGQGNDVYYVKLWNWIWENQEQLQTAKSSVLRDVYSTYFAKKDPGANPLYKMVKDAYFGMECIGFVSNYLRHIGLWSQYLGVDNHNWSIHFPQKILRLEDARSLDLLEWTTVGHVALIDEVYGVTNGTLKLDVSQCSGLADLKGPMSNAGLSLSLATAQGGDGHPWYTISGPTGTVPVTGDLQIRRTPGLQYSSPRRPYTPLEFPKTANVFPVRRNS